MNCCSFPTQTHQISEADCECAICLAHFRAGDREACSPVLVATAFTADACDSGSRLARQIVLLVGMNAAKGRRESRAAVVSFKSKSNPCHNSHNRHDVRADRQGRAVYTYIMVSVVDLASVRKCACVCWSTGAFPACDGRSLGASPRARVLYMYMCTVYSEVSSSFGIGSRRRDRGPRYIRASLDREQRGERGRATPWTLPVAGWAECALVYSSSL